MAGKNNNRRNVVRNASTRPKGFYLVLGAIAVVGVSLLGYSLLNKRDGAVGTPVNVGPAVIGSAQGYTLGRPDAPVKIIEFADFECPGCAQFATVTEPDVRKRIVDAGLASFTFYDLPLPQHKNSKSASLAAACANDQGKFWEMHDRIFAGQNQWNTQAADNPKPFFQKYASDVGLNGDAWETCYDSNKYASRILANLAEGERRRVTSTPTFIVGDKMYPGALPYDALKAIVDSATQSAGAAPPGQ